MRRAHIEPLLGKPQLNLVPQMLELALLPQERRAISDPNLEKLVPLNFLS